MKYFLIVCLIVIHTTASFSQTSIGIGVGSVSAAYVTNTFGQPWLINDGFKNISVSYSAEVQHRFDNNLILRLSASLQNLTEIWQVSLPPQFSNIGFHESEFVTADLYMGYNLISDFDIGVSYTRGHNKSHKLVAFNNPNNFTTFDYNHKLNGFGFEFGYTRDYMGIRFGYTSLFPKMIDADYASIPATFSLQRVDLLELKLIIRLTIID